jgi:hypothetical protein
MVPEQKIARPASKDKLPAFVLEGVRLAIAKMDVSSGEATWTPLTLAGYTEPVISLPVLVDEDGVINEVVLHSADGTVRQRRACFVQICIPGQSATLNFIVESSARNTLPQFVQTDAADLVQGLSKLMRLQQDKFEGDSP